MANNDDPMVNERGNSNRATESKKLLDTAKYHPGKIKEIDQMRALIQEGFLRYILRANTRDIISEANKL
ncbi:hypothetical protein IT397_03085, partial [Candidatus Nomurabacteria bacterium]|nr:hypothetical protein [Candidatus Nomurabacteria bacterium]